MVIKCAVRRCKSRFIKNNGIRFYRLPLDDSELLVKWLIALKVYNWEPTKYYKQLKVCHKHFKEDCFPESLSKLSSDAVPSIFPKSTKLKKIISKKIENQRLQCSVPGCKSPKDTQCFKLPFDDDRLFSIWITRIGLSLLYDIKTYCKIAVCQNHFHESCFTDNLLHLKNNAMPSMNLIDYQGPPENCLLMNMNSSDSKENSTMSTTGDRTWGWLGSTEHFGRPSEPNEFVLIPKLHIHDEKYKCSTQAAHCMIYAENNKKVFNIYNPRATILMQLRFDGYFGFPGGLVDSNEDFVSAVNREMVEEMNLNTDLYSVTNDDHVVSHWSEKKNLTLHFYKLKVSMDELIEIEKGALLARDYGSEVLGTARIPLYTMGDNYRGFPVFLNHKFIGSAKEQLLTSLSLLNIMTNEEIILALNSISA